MVTTLCSSSRKAKTGAEYGNRLLETIASDIKKAGIKGLTAPELSRCRQFYFIYPEIFGTLSQKSFPQLSKIIGTLSHESKPAKIPGEAFLASEKLVNSLSFSHFVELIKIHDPLKRSYYELLTIRHTLSIRQLKREINTLSYERTALSKDKDLSLKKIAAHVQPDEPVQAIKDVYVFDFLGLADYNSIEEADLEKALLDHLQEFLIELGHGFCFESRQQKILIGDRYYFIDLVFYHRILKCHVLIDLKVDELDHVNAGQLNTYLNYYKKEVSQPNDNPPVGILMVTNKNEALVEYATAGMTTNFS